MNGPTKLAAFALAVAAAFGVGIGVGDMVGPFDSTDDRPPAVEHGVDHTGGRP